MTQTQVTAQTIRTEREPGGDIPEAVANYFAAHPEFADRLSHDKDTEKLLKLSKSDCSREDAEAMAWLLWRARVVLNWNRHPTTRLPLNSWPECVNSAWLKDELFQMCQSRRKDYYAKQAARRERLDKLIQTGIE